MERPLFRWGILGSAQIARKNWKAIRNSQNGIITAVASRDLERGRRFIDACQADAPFETKPLAVGSYEELLAAADVDGIYMPLPTGIRKEWVLRAGRGRQARGLRETLCGIGAPTWRRCWRPAGAMRFNSWTGSCSCTRAGWT